MKKIDTLLPEFKPIVEAVLADLETRGIKCAITSARRTLSEQESLYAQGRTKAGAVVTKARAGESAHNFGTAVDLCPLDSSGDCNWGVTDDVWHVIALVAQEHGLEAGYFWKNFQDKPHLQLPTWKQQQALWRQGKIQVA